MRGDGPMPDIMAGASFGTALRIALCTVVIVSRRSAGRAARNSTRVGSVLGMRRGCAFGAQQSNLHPADDVFDQPVLVSPKRRAFARELLHAKLKHFAE